jgi:hypothetical protein
MVLSNAERQKRHRERVKDKLATLADDNGGDEGLKELLVGQFIAAGSEMLARHLEAVSKIYEAANREFLRTYAERRF